MVVAFAHCGPTLVERRRVTGRNQSRRARACPRRASAATHAGGGSRLVELPNARPGACRGGSSRARRAGCYENSSFPRRRASGSRRRRGGFASISRPARRPFSPLRAHLARPVLRDRRGRPDSTPGPASRVRDGAFDRPRLRCRIATMTRIGLGIFRPMRRCCVRGGVRGTQPAFSSPRRFLSGRHDI